MTLVIKELVGIVFVMNKKSFSPVSERKYSYNQSLLVCYAKFYSKDYLYVCKNEKIAKKAIKKWIQK